MAGDVRGKNVCDYTYAVCGLSMLLSLLTAIFLCITCNMCGMGRWLEFAAEGFQTAWWVIAGIVISKKVRDSNDKLLVGPDGMAEHMPGANWRNAVAVMTWVAALLSLLTALVYLAESVKSVAKCCGWCKGKGDDSSHGREHQYHEEGKKEGKKEGKEEGKKEGKKDVARTVDYGYGEQPFQPPGPQAVGVAGDEAARANAV